MNRPYDNRLLMIVDPQIDFITGALPVPGAAAAMDALAAYIRDSSGTYCHIIVTADRHPFGHCSFIQCGGPWPRHCVHDSIGAAVWQSLMDSLYDFDGVVTFLYKGENPAAEEYSIFKNRRAAAQIDSILTADEISIIDICGLAGDICVADTLRDGIALYGQSRFNLLKQFSPTLAGNSCSNDVI